MESKCNSNPSTPGRTSSDQRRGSKKGSEKKKKRKKEKEKEKEKESDRTFLYPGRSSISQSCFFSRFLFLFSFPQLLLFLSRLQSIHHRFDRVCTIPSFLSVFLSFFFIFYFLFFIFIFIFASCSNGCHPLASSSKLS